MYPSWMRNLLLYFDLWGFCSQFKRSPYQQKIDLLILVFHVISGTVTSYSISLYLQRGSADTLGNLNDILKFSVLMLGFWFSIFELYFKQKTQQKFWNLLEHIDRKFSSHEQFSISKFLFKIRLYFGVTAISYFIFLHRLIANSGDMYLDFWFSYIFVVLAYQNRSFYYLFYLEIMKYELNLIYREVGEILCDRHSGKLKDVWKKKGFMKQFCRIRFKWIREFYETIYEMNNTINTIFGYSNVAVILLSFHLVLADINWFYWKLLNRYQFSILGKISNFNRRNMFFFFCNIFFVFSFYFFLIRNIEFNLFLFN